MITVNNSTNNQLKFLEVTESESGQRIDNYLMKQLKGVPKSLVYRLLRKGAVRVNKKRRKPEYKIQAGDIVKIPPVHTAESGKVEIPERVIEQLKASIVYEDDSLMVLNKASGMAVHGGSGLAWGLIEGLRKAFPDYEMIELAHRLDRFTSGCLLLARSRPVLLNIQEQIKSHQIDKRYLTLTKGQWTPNTEKGEVKINTPLRKNAVQGGERMVQVSEDGKEALSYFRTQHQYADAALCEVEIITGRTHQIRVHAASEGHPVAGDLKYGDDAFNKQMKQIGLSRLFLHAKSLTLLHPETNKPLTVEAPLPRELNEVLSKLN